MHTRRIGRFLFSAICLLAFAGTALGADQLSSAASPTASQSQTKWALVIGNSDYTDAPLANPANDARDLSKVLEGLGFTVTTKLNASQSEMKRSVREFSDKLKESGGIGLFYFAGHGVQTKGRNYLIPTGTDIRREYEVPDQSVDANFVLDAFEYAGNRLNVMILDACRNNPYARKFRSMGAGLSRMDAPSGVLIAFSTKPDSVANDGTDGNGLYTKHLLGALRTPGLTIEGVFKRVRELVEKESDGLQSPREESALKGADFYFVAPTGESVASGFATLDFESLKQQAEAGNATAQAALGARYADGTQGVPLSLPDAILWLERAAAQGNVNAQFNLAWMYYSGRGVAKDFGKAIEWGLKAAEQGHRKAQYYAGSIYESGELGLNKEPKEAAKWYRKAAEQGESDAQTALGRMYYQGRGVEQDHGEAFKWLTRGSDGGSIHAKAELAGLFMLGQGTTVDLAKARSLAEEAARGGSAAAKLLLGRMYFDGLGQPKDWKAARTFLLEAKGGGYWQADSYLSQIDGQSGAMRSQMSESTQSTKEALLRKAEVGDTKAMMAVARALEKGESGFDKSMTEAERWYRRGAAAGNGSAQLKLGELIVLKQVEKPDLVEAEQLFRSAVALEIPGARFWLGSLLLKKKAKDAQLEAILFLQKDAKAGDQYAQAELGAAYYYGTEFIEEDHAAAKKWYELAAPQGHQWAQLNLGILLLEDPNRTPMDIDKARQLFELSSNQGNGYAMHRLGFIYEDGIGVPPDLVKALKHYRPAADRDVWDAQFRIATAYARGEGGYPIDPKLAVYWIEKASNSGYPPAMREFGAIRAIGYGGTVKDLDEGKRLLKAAADKGDQIALDWISTKHLERLGKPPRLGIEMADVNADGGQDQKGGVLVVSVVPDSVAAKVAIQQGDVIRRINGEDVSGPKHLLQRLAQIPESAPVSLSVVKKGSRNAVEVQVK